MKPLQFTILMLMLLLVTLYLNDLRSEAEKTNKILNKLTPDIKLVSPTLVEIDSSLTKIDSFSNGTITTIYKPYNN